MKRLVFALHIVLSMVLCALSGAPSARAQDTAERRPDEAPSASQVALARRLFGEGVTAAQEHRLDDARAAFERSYALSQREVTLLNLAVVLAEAGELVAAADTYRRFLARADGEIEARHGETARTALAGIEARLGYMTIVVRRLRDADVVRIDDAAIAREGLGLEVPVDPGTHSVEVLRGSRSCVRRSVRVTPRAHVDLELDATCPPSPEEVAAAAAATEQAERDAARRATEGDGISPWVIVGIGAGVLAVAAAIIVIVLLTQPEPLDPYVGNLGPGTLELP